MVYAKFSPEVELYTEDTNAARLFFDRDTIRFYFLLATSSCTQLVFLLNYWNHG